VGLVEVTQVQRKLHPVDRGACGQSLDRLVQAVAVDHPFRTDADVVVEESLQAAFVDVPALHKLIDGLLHSAVMTQGKPQHWSVTVVPDSGTDALSGLAGAMTITITDGKYDYDFAYTLPAP
jgi:uncharacterized protein DUF3224